MISLGTQNGLLALLAYTGVRNIPDQDLKEETSTGRFEKTLVVYSVKEAIHVSSTLHHNIIL